jgi:uncharacterized protein involved in response to NO
VSSRAPWATAREPLLFILHIGYCWLVAGVTLLGMSVQNIVPKSAAIHALTAGAIGTMILAVMTRATLGHSGRTLSADAATRTIYALVSIAALSRVVAAFSGNWMIPFLDISAAFWIGAFGLFILRFGPMMLRPRADAGL